MSQYNRSRLLPTILFSILITTTLPAAALQEVIVGFHSKPGVSEREMIDALGGTIEQEYDLIPAVVALLPDSSMGELHNHPLVAFVEQNSEVIAIEPEAELPLTEAEMESASEDEYLRAWGILHIGAREAHRRGITGKGVKIAVIDTGIDYHHEDLDDNYRGGYNFVAHNDSPLDDSINSHGTNVAGIIAAERNGTGVVGVAPEASLYALKVLNSYGSGLTSHLIAALQWSVEHDMDIANISIQGAHSEALQAACDAAYKAGVLIVAAAGNSYGDPVSHPAAYSSVIAVTGTDSNDQDGFFAPVDSRIELSAPGTLIASTAIGNRYGMLSGTSQAAPHVTGTAALLMSVTPPFPTIQELKNNEVTRIRLQLSAMDLGLAGKDELYGYGLVDATLPAPSIDKVTCSSDTITVTGRGFGRFLDNASSTMTAHGSGVRSSCSITTWTTSMIIASCGIFPAGPIRTDIHTLFGDTFGFCDNATQTAGRPRWWALESWWSSWSWFHR